jgi:3D (Asp-Asp-Asp) domain-containing protein
LRTLCLVALAGAAVCATLPAGGSAESEGELERRAEALRKENASLFAGAHSASAALHTIEQRLEQARAELAFFQVRAAQVRARRRAVTTELGVARSSLHGAQRALARRLQTLYEREETDTLAVILGAGSLEEALNAIETLDRAATQDEELIEKARSSSARLTALSRRLSSRERELEQLAAARAAAAASLADARARRIETIAALRSTSRANATRIATLEDRARALASVSVPASVSAPATATEADAPPLQPGPGSGVHSLTVVATAYSLPGRTASGRPVGWGVVAVDPSLIPMGSRLSIPGYGIGVAADTGGAIQGAKIDLWFPTLGQARAWGTRVVTITVFPA